MIWKKWTKRKKQKEQITEELTEVQKCLQDYEEALTNKDPDKMERALRKAKSCCKNANSLCLEEIFCPECPFGGLPVMSGRMGMSK